LGPWWRELFENRVKLVVTIILLTDAEEIVDEKIAQIH
jgi:hypothetical protein